MLQIVSLILLILGLLSIAVGILGIYRFNNIFITIHVLSLIDNVCINLMLWGLIFIQKSYINILQIIFIICLLLLLSPLSSHLMASIAYNINKKVW